LSEMTLIKSFRTNFNHCGQSFRTCFSTSGWLSFHVDIEKQ
jgi:hypothetical protein